jgi:hypothetical protein
MSGCGDVSRIWPGFTSVFHHGTARRATVASGHFEAAYVNIRPLRDRCSETAADDTVE